MSWQPPENYEPIPNLEQSLRNTQTPEVGSALFKMVSLVASGSDVADLGLSQRQARKAIENRLVPKQHYKTVERVALGRPPQPHGSERVELTREFRFLVEDLPAWDPEGSTDIEKLDRIADLAEASFEPADSTDEHAFDNPDIPAGYTYLGQFIDHDITRDKRDLTDAGSDAPPLPLSIRTPALELDSVYGDTPGSGAMYDGSGRFRIGRGFGDGEIDLPREKEDDKSHQFNPQQIKPNKAVIGDNRNDENLLVAHVHLGFLKFHNKQMDKGADFEEARRETIRHYQWIVLYDFLAKTCGEEFVTELVRDPEKRVLNFPQGGEVFMPVEFSMGAYRFGHSMVRPDYELNDPLTEMAGEIPIFATGNMPLSGLRGGRRLPPNWQLQMDRFFDFKGTNGRGSQQSRRIDTKLAPPLVHLPIDVSNERLKSLPFRNLRRGWENGLPSGQDLARHYKLDVVNGGSHTPLWLYILNEAKHQNGGRRLGTLGAHLVVETFIGLIENTGISVLRENWAPATQPFQMPDLLKEAGMPIHRADLPFA